MSEIHIDAHVRAPHRVLYSAQSLLTFVIILLAGASVLLAQEDVWSGFRGQLRQGKSATQLQTLTWSANDNVLWKTPLPGLGLSSPIVKGDKVFVTTSYPTTTAAWVTRAVAILRLVLCTGLFAAVIIITVNDPRVSAVGDFLRATVLLFCTSALMILAIYDANLFDYARCPIRTWIGTSMSVNLCLGIAACLVRGRMWLKWSTLAAAVAFAFILYTGVPDRDHVMRTFPDSHFSPNLTVFVAVVTAPLMIGVLSQFRFTGTRKWGWFQSGPAFREAARVGGAVVAAEALALSALAVLALVLLVVARNSRYLGYHLSNVRLVPMLPAEVVYAVAGSAFGIVMMVGLWFRPFAKVRADRTILATLGAAVAVATVTFAGVNYQKDQGDMQVRSLVELDLRNGKIKRVDELASEPVQQLNRFNSPATPTPLVDGNTIYSYFGNAGMFGSTESGRVIWRNVQLPFNSAYGPGASPALASGKLIYVSDNPHDAYIACLDATSGKELWRQQRQKTQVSGSSRTPLIVQSQGKDVVLVYGTDLKGYDLLNGSTLFTYPVEDSGGDLVASIALSNDLIVLPAESSIHGVSLSKLMSGDVGKARVWLAEGDSANVASPIIKDDLVFVVGDSGFVICLDTTTGSRLWEASLPGQYFSSPVVAGNVVLFTNHKGVTTVIAADRTFRTISRNEIQESVLASLIPIQGRLLIRGESHLYLIGETIYRASTDEDF